jgi:hypothetical protein
VNWRAAGCATLAIAAFLAVGLLGISRAFGPAECPGQLPYQPAPYEPIGEPTGEPFIPGVDADLERAGAASFGLASWEVWVEPGTAPSASAAPLPSRIVLDCRDGSFQAYERTGE